ncbi:hypothetical protein HB825_06850 [Listeria booriae]|uniref:hypothetical protein n=1 Tax=Listeria booriae TaxID=1552123 RepID=UPI00164E7C39|nr:hypothetical protein [Listeria booriae]MBC1530006.1 hypothetical protein [Listeria booriae]MBC6134552.1 hypothetical protein [Listeria booriae]
MILPVDVAVSADASVLAPKSPATVMTPIAAIFANVFILLFLISNIFFVRWYVVLLGWQHLFQCDFDYGASVNVQSSSPE